VAAAVWQYDTGPWSDVWVTRYLPASGWTGAQKLENDDYSNAWEARIAVDPIGNALAVWTQDKGGSTGFQIYASRSLSGGGWSAPVRVSGVGEGWMGNPPSSAQLPSLAVGVNGDALLAWQTEVSNHGTKVLASRMDGSSGSWSVPIFLDPCAGPSECSTGTLEPQAQISSAGEGIVIFVQGASRHQLFATHSSGGAWSAPIALESGSDDVAEAQLAVGGGGTAMAVWHQNTNEQRLELARYEPTTGWSAPVALSGPAEVTGGMRPKLHIDDRGNALLLFDQQGPILAARWLASTQNWSEPTVIAAQGGGEYDVSFAFVPGCGNAIAVWYGSDGVSALRFH
jgi:hypothetical protein